jgi:hypothetical protein
MIEERTVETLKLVPSSSLHQPKVIKVFYERFGERSEKSCPFTLAALSKHININLRFGKYAQLLKFTKRQLGHQSRRITSKNEFKRKITAININ